jgi:hypothetical protein
MAVYRFRVSFEDNEEIYREIEIKSTQNFEDFHNIIVQTIGFDNLHDASFHISDDYWRKGDEIGLRALDEDEIAKRKRNDQPVKKQMNKCKMASLIDDPHQKFVYVYDPKANWTFLVELVKILLDDAKGSFPKCIKTVGESPKQHKATTVPVVEEDEFDEEEPHHDDEAYVNAHSEDETALLEGEEGEEEETEEEAHDEEAEDSEELPEAGFDED